MVTSFSFMSVDSLSFNVKSSHPCWSCNSNWVCWLMYDIDLHPLTGADEVSRDVVAPCHYHISLCVDVMSLLLLFKTVYLFLYFLGRNPLFPMLTFCQILNCREIKSLSHLSLVHMLPGSAQKL
jgi:hypothetical protein